MTAMKMILCLCESAVAVAEFREVVALASEVEVEVAIGIEICGVRGCSNAGFTLIGGVGVADGEGMSVMPGEAVICGLGVD
jgi:hypothetical protein